MAPKRTQAVLDALRVLENCSNTSNYCYAHEEIEQIFSAIEQLTKEVRDRFSTTSSKKPGDFVLIPSEDLPNASTPQDLDEDLKMRMSSTAMIASENKSKRGRKSLRSRFDD